MSCCFQRQQMYNLQIVHSQIHRSQLHYQQTPSFLKNFDIIHKQEQLQLVNAAAGNAFRNT